MAQWIIKHLLSILAGAAIIVIIVIVIYMGVEFTSTSDDYSYLSSDSSVEGKKEQFYNEYIEQEEANQEAIASGDSTAGTSSVTGAAGSSGGSLSLNTTAEQIKTKLEANSTYASKAYCLSLMYQVLTEDLNMSSACAVGFMANVMAEGDVRLVEKMFSTKNHDSNGKQVNYYADGTFKLPSGSTTFNTMADVNYLYSWTTSTNTFKYYNSSGELTNVKIGSCGVSCVQWSFNRRLTYLDILKGVITSNGGDVNNSSQVISDDWAAEAASIMVKEELSGNYNASLTTYAINESGYNVSNQAALAGEWAKVFCYHYEKPGEIDDQATARANTAIDMYSYLFE